MKFFSRFSCKTRRDTWKTSPTHRRGSQFESLEARSLLATFTVINIDDSGAGSLRQAILDANSNPGADQIGFNIPGAGAHTIAPLTSFPAMSEVTIDGTTQPGFVAGGPRLIELSGIITTYDAHPIFFFPQEHSSLRVTGDSTINGLAINRFDVGIFVVGANNHIEGNYVGTDPTGSLALPNLWGVHLHNTGSHNRVGTNGDGVDDEAERNIISGNAERGVGFFGDSNVVAGNYIGTDVTGMYAIANYDGVFGGASNSTLAGNVISGNYDAGVRIGSLTVQGNLIGTDKTGNTALPNHVGIFLQFGGEVLIGGTTSEARNVITGNEIGIRISADSSVIQGNYIGRTLSGEDLGNSQEGIYQEHGSSIIGGRMPGEGNVISGNNYGIVLERYSGGVDRIQGNLIVNNGLGVALLDGTANQVIGGTDVGAGNTIAFNGTGVIVGRNVGGQPPDPFYPYSKQNRIVGNSIFGNTGLGIDLSDGSGGQGDGVTSNDPLDADIGSNDFQNFPELTAASSAASTQVQGSLHSTPSSSFALDFYANSAVDSSGYGEGERWLGTATVNTDSNGNATFVAVVPGSSSIGEFITATATDSAGNTSEFSSAVEVLIQTVQIQVTGDASVNLASNGVISVAIFSTAGFNAAQVNVGSVIFAGAHATQSSLKDVNCDGLLDLVLKFHTQDTTLRLLYEQLLADDINADGELDSNHQTAMVELSGETVDHILIQGFSHLDLFLSGKKLRDLLDQLAAAGAI